MQGVEFTLDGSVGGLLLECCGVPRVSGRSKMWVATLSPDVVNCREGSPVSCLSIPWVR